MSFCLVIICTHTHTHSAVQASALSDVTNSINLTPAGESIQSHSHIPSAGRAIKTTNLTFTIKSKKLRSQKLKETQREHTKTNVS